jgi:hypothetical protein
MSATEGAEVSNGASALSLALFIEVRGRVILRTSA